MNLMRQKLGFRSQNIELQNLIDRNVNDDREDFQSAMTLNSSEEFTELLTNLLFLLQSARVDYTNFFRQLPSVLIGNASTLNESFARMKVEWNEWVFKYKHLIEIDRTSVTPHRKIEDVIQQMNRINPKFVLRNHLAQQAINKAKRGDFSEIQKLLEILQHPFDEQPNIEPIYTQTAPDWARNLTVSCSS
jgi:uncharacterized protein YdiU (UPF0061 family)